MSNAGLGSPYWYEWEIGLIECLKMMNNQEIESVVLQSSEFQALDDVVVHFKDNSIINIQVKHTDANNNFTYSFLTTGDNPLLKTLATEWRKEKRIHNIREIQLVTNKKWGTSKSDGKCSMFDFVTEVYPKLQNDFSYSGEDKYQENAINWFKNELSFLGDECEKFVKVFSIRAVPGLIELDKSIREQIVNVIGTNKEESVNFCLKNIRAKLNEWSTSRRRKQEITKEDFYQALCEPEYDIPKYELYPEKPIFPSRERFASKFIEQIKSNHKKIFFLEGFPGSGKTNFVSYIAQLDNSIVDFRYYTYLPVDRDNASYSDDEGYYSGRLLWLSILTQMKKKFSELKILSLIGFPIIYKYLSVSEMRRYVLKYLPIYSQKIGRTCYFFIDGMDHAARSNDARNSFLMQIPCPEEIGEGVKFILVGQPINDKYPNWLVNNSNIEYIHMPSLETDDISKLLIENKIIMENINVKLLSNTIISVVGSNALNVMFAMLELKKMTLPLSFERVEETLKNRYLNCQIDKYYEWIINSTEKDLLFYKLEAIFGYSSRKITLSELVQLCGSNEEDVSFVLNKLYPMVLKDDKGYYAFHNDVRLHFKNEIKVCSNYDGITKSLYGCISENEMLEIYKYDILFDLLLNLDDTGKMFGLMDVEYIIKSVRFDVSFDKLSKQFLYIMKMLLNKRDFNYLKNASAVSLSLSQFSNCIKYYEKESIYIENQTPFHKTMSEKYVLDSKKSIEQIVNDMYYLLKKGQIDRGTKLFHEYLKDKNINELLKIKAKKKNIFRRLGFVYRYMKTDILDEECDDVEYYADFVDGWLQASVNFLTSDDIKRTFKFKSYYPESLHEYVVKICENEFLEEESFLLLKEILFHESKSISELIDLCVLGIVNGYDSSDLVEYIYTHVSKVIDDKIYQFNTDKILVCIKALFCIYLKKDYDEIEKVYMKILELCHIDETKRGYNPSIAQKEIAFKIYDIYFRIDKNSSLNIDVLSSFFYFTDRYGVGSCFDCSADKVFSFLRKIFVYYAKSEPNNRRVAEVCENIVSIIYFKGTRYISDFDVLFYYAGKRDEFIQFANFWCGYNGAIWNKEYDEVEHCCTSIMSVLRMFNEQELCGEIEKRKLYKLFGYVGRKDYSLMNLIDFYENIPLSENKLLINGMQLLSISDAASSIGDNRLSMDVDQVLFDVAGDLGIQFVNALFELKNRPDSLNYWRDILLRMFYKKIYLITSDEELMALYRLTNGWINAYFESFREYGRLNLLKEYNSIILNRVTNDEMKKEIKKMGNCYFEESEKDYQPISKYDKNEIISIIKTEGYSEAFVKMICKTIEDRDSGVLNLLIELKDILPQQYLFDFANDCIIKYILFNCEYGFFGAGIKHILKVYRSYLSEDAWIDIFENIVFRLSDNEIDQIRNIGEDIGIYTINFLMRFKPESMEDAFKEMCDAHKAFISANGQLMYNTYDLYINKNVNTLQEMVKYQLGYDSSFNNNDF